MRGPLVAHQIRGMICLQKVLCRMGYSGKFFTVG